MVTDIVARFKLKLCLLRAQSVFGAPGAGFRRSPRRQSRQGVENVRERGWHRNCSFTRPYPMGESRLQNLKGPTMHIKGVLHALAVAARVAILLPTVGLAWLIWSR